jgi:protein-tyrosine-phosphatase
MNAVVPLYRVLFVCAGNTCRSPLAAAALSRALGDDGRRVEIQSAGVIEVAKANGLDLDAHRAQRVSIPLLERADLVLALGPGELEVVRRMSPDAGRRAHLLPDFDCEHPTGEGVPDPFGGSREAYEECLRRVAEHVVRVAAVVAREVRARGEAESASRDRGAA